MHVRRTMQPDRRDYKYRASRCESDRVVWNFLFLFYAAASREAERSDAFHMQLNGMRPRFKSSEYLEYYLEYYP